MVYGLGASAASREPPQPPLETIEVRTRDGQTLFADVREPASSKPVGVAVLAHAMFARRSEFEKPSGQGLAELFASAGYVTVAFDFRGHGDSGPHAQDGADWSYDDLVRSDLPAVAGCAKGRFPALPLVVVGHSLGGHVALASQGTGILEADALVLVAANVWLRRLELSRRLWLTKRAVAESLVLLSKKRGYFPARMLRIGSDDEAARYILALTRTTREGRWTSDDGREDYGELTSRIRVPVATITSQGDRLMCTPDCGERMVASASGPRLSLRVRKADDGSPPPGHMELVTSGQVRKVYRSALAWLSREMPPQTP
jgi:predicted alpha/beta hydrolase